MKPTDEKVRTGSSGGHTDIIHYGSMPYTDFIRTQTLCQGGEMCDFRFVCRQTDAGDGWNRT